MKSDSPTVSSQQCTNVWQQASSFSFLVWGLRPGSKVRNGFRFRVDRQSWCEDQDYNLPMRVLTKVEVQEYELTDSDKFLCFTKNVWSLSLVCVSCVIMREVVQLSGKCLSVCTEPGFQYAAAADKFGLAKELALKQKQGVYPSWGNWIYFLLFLHRRLLSHSPNLEMW